MSRILIIEDDPAIMEALTYNLTNAGFETLSASDGIAGLEKALASKPDVVLLDLMLPKMDGVTVCRKLRRHDQEVRVIMITALGTDQDKVKGLDVGADDYVTKPFSFDELLARVKAQLRRAGPDQSASQLSFGDVEIDRTKHEVKVGGRPVGLRPKEFKLLVTLASNPGVLFSREQLGEIIWDSNFVGSSRTIDVHIRRLREKIEKASTFKFIKTAHGLGYRFELEKASDSA